MINPYHLSIHTDCTGNMVEEEVFRNMEPIPLGGFATFGRRLAARTIDFGVHYLLTLIAGALFFAAIVLFRPELLEGDLVFLRIQAFEVNHPLPYLSSSVVIYLVYNMIADAWGGGFGKLVTGLVVLREGGLTPGSNNALLRNITLPLEALFLGVFAAKAMRLSEKRQRWGDRLGHTVVACRRTLPRDLQPNPWLWAGGLCLAATGHVGLTFGLLWSVAV